MRHIWLICSTIFILASAMAPGDKAIIKAVNQVFPGSENETIKVDLPEQFHIYKFNKELYLILAEQKLLGYAMFSSILGRYEYFDYVVVYSADPMVKMIKIINYRSTHGSAVASRRWLRQFEGPRGEVSYIYEENIQALSGATISANALVRDMNLNWDIINHLMESNTIEYIQNTK